METTNFICRSASKFKFVFLADKAVVISLDEASVNADQTFEAFNLSAAKQFPPMNQDR